jgi:hypothetical protein
MSAENREEVALRGREYVERNYDWQKNLTALDDMLAQLGNRPTQDAPLRDANAAAGEEQARHRFGTSRASLAGVKR